MFITDGADVSNCPANLHVQQGDTLKVYQDHCYEFKLHHLTDWPHAADDCKSRGGTLVVVNDLAEQDLAFGSDTLMQKKKGRGNGSQVTYFNSRSIIFV